MSELWFYLDGERASKAQCYEAIQKRATHIDLEYAQDVFFRCIEERGDGDGE
jgi:hypothetical protein